MKGITPKRDVAAALRRADAQALLECQDAFSCMDWPGEENKLFGPCFDAGHAAAAVGAEAMLVG